MPFAVGQDASGQCSPLVPQFRLLFSATPTEKQRKTVIKATPLSSADDRT
ncbi:hypothetical protein Fmac_009973 [Flemingia macrophylla]|uniref:Uncharacterized protein n=1 Tax=Flemingia macrophylla TaxID=520843 RepID=A0ABD1N312_9FABA